jgi:hypothetical protein
MAHSLQPRGSGILPRSTSRVLTLEHTCAEKLTQDVEFSRVARSTAGAEASAQRHEKGDRESSASNWAKGASKHSGRS